LFDAGRGKGNAASRATIFFKEEEEEGGEPLESIHSSSIADACASSEASARLPVRLQQPGT
jgi:hypothetical protein